jgi:hypothetical protein
MILGPGALIQCKMHLPTKATLSNTASTIKKEQKRDHVSTMKPKFIKRIDENVGLPN